MRAIFYDKYNNCEIAAEQLTPYRLLNENGETIGTLVYKRNKHNDFAWDTHCWPEDLRFVRFEE